MAFPLSLLALSQLHPISTPSPTHFYLSDYCFPFCLFLSSLSAPLSLSLAATMRCDWPTSPFLSSSASSPLHLARFVFLSHPFFRVPVLHASFLHPLFFLLTTATNCALSVICWWEYRLQIPIIFYAHPISPLEGAANVG